MKFLYRIKLPKLKNSKLSFVMLICVILFILIIFFILESDIFRKGKEYDQNIIFSDSNDLTQTEINEISKSIVQLECSDENGDPIYGTGVYINRYLISRQATETLKL